MAWEAYLRAAFELPVENSEELVQSQNSVMLRQDHHVSQTGGSSVINPTNLSHSINQMQFHDQLTYPNAQFVHGDMNIQAYSNSPPSGFTHDESSLITDGNSSISVSSYFNSVNNSTEGSPASNCAISGSPQFPAQNQNSQEYQNGLRLCKRQGESLSNPISMSKIVRSMYQTPVSPMINIKRPRLDRQEGSSSMQLPPQYSMQQAPSLFIQPNLLPTNQQHIAASIINPQRTQINLVPNSQQFPVESQNVASLQRGMYAHRLMCYLNHQRHRPPDNNIGFWRKFVEEYYTPGVKRRWCLSKYENVGRQGLSIFPPASMNSWTCDLCTSILAKGLVATFETLPRLKKAYFDSGVTDELLFVDSPSERRLSSGYVVLWYSKAVQETLYKDFRVVHEGKLRIVFTPQLKIISWEFCVQHHEEIVPRRLVAPQIEAMVKNAVKCHSDFEKIGTDEVTREDLISNCNRLQAAGQELAKKLELPIVNELGFSKNLVRNFQMTDVFDCMKDLMSYSLDTNLSPIESLRRYPEDVVNAKKMKEIELQSQMLNSQVSPPGFRVPNNFMPQTSNNPQQAPYIASSSSNPIQCGPHNYQTGPSQKPLVGPSSSSFPSQRDMYDNMLADLLKSMRNEGEFGSWLYRSKDPMGKSRIVFDPNVVKPEVVFTQVPSKDKGKGMNASSSTNSKPEVKKVKREPDSEEDFASSSHAPETSKKNGKAHH